MTSASLRDVIHGGVSLIAAFLLQAALQRVAAPVLLAVNVFAVTVIVFAVLKGELAGAIMGLACGLVVDSFSLGIFGLAGIANTVTGYAAGYVSRKINVLLPSRMVVFIGLMGLLDFSLWVLLTSVFFGQAVPWDRGLVFVQPLLTAVLGTLTYTLIRKLKARRDG
jgi:rod shape-determining protein MreD